MDRPIPRWRQAGKGSQNQKGAITAPERHPTPNCKQASLLTKNSWDSGQSTFARKIAAREQLPRRRRAHCTPRKPNGWDSGGDKSHPSTGDDYAHQGSGHLSCSDLERVQNAGPTKSAPLWSIREPEPERLKPGKGMQTRACSRQLSAEQHRA